MTVQEIKEKKNLKVQVQVQEKKKNLTVQVQEKKKKKLKLKLNLKLKNPEEPEEPEEPEDCACPGCGVTDTSDKKDCPFCLLSLDRDANMSKKAYVIQEIAQVVNDIYNSILEHIFEGKYTPSNNEKINRVIKDNLRIVSVDKVKKSVLNTIRRI